MVIVDLKTEELIITAEMTPNKKLLFDLEYQLNALHTNDTTGRLEKALQLFVEHIDETLLKISRSNETKIRMSLSDVVVRHIRRKEQVTEFDYESEKSDYITSFSELKDAVIPSLNNSNDSIFNDDFTIEMGFEAAIGELSVIDVEESINSVITNTATAISTLSIHPEDLKQIFQPKD
ncbi:hypothetical protein BgiMline_036909 [Biomphalaria glabrata]|nr:hypothetical protein BgiMline_015285 [Biomphalaria glabrata]